MTASHRVLHLITELDIGGAQKALARLLSRLDRSRFEPSVACLYNGDRAVGDEIRALGIRVTDLGMRARWRWDAFGRLYRLLRRERPALLHTWMFHANIPGRILGRLAGVPIVITSRRNVNIGGARRELLTRWTAGLDDKVIAVCELARQSEIERARVSPDKVVTIYNGVDITPFSAASPEAIAEARRSFGIPADALLVGSVGRLHPQKDYGTLIASMARVREGFPDVHLVLVGDGPLRGPLKSLAQSLGLSESVTLAGERTDIPEILGALQVFVLPSLWEGLPNAILEAMAARLPVVATSVGGVPEAVVDGVTGLIVPPRDPEALAEAVQALLQSGDLRRQMGRAGQRRAIEHFSIDRTVDQTEALYERLLGERVHEGKTTS